MPPEKSLVLDLSAFLSFQYTQASGAEIQQACKLYKKQCKLRKILNKIKLQNRAAKVHCKLSTRHTYVGSMLIPTCAFMNSTISYTDMQDAVANVLHTKTTLVQNSSVLNSCTLIYADVSTIAQYSLKLYYTNILYSNQYFIYSRLASQAQSQNA